MGNHFVGVDAANVVVAFGTDEEIAEAYGGTDFDPESPVRMVIHDGMNQQVVVFAGSPEDWLSLANRILVSTVAHRYERRPG